MMPSLLLRLCDDYPLDEEELYLAGKDKDWILSELDMLFTSRPRFLYLETLPLVNTSVLNFGINESLLPDYDVEDRKKIIAERIKNTLKRFEPRLTDVTIIIKADNPDHVIFEINALHQELPMKFELIWDDCTGKFYLDE
ncbi:GPW/gp25 family protein [Citrobacter braakii]|uniref:GPW/gp25 family protein n=1 Tax=Citrobacter braakii TaxID=57706 RepID=UPI000CDCE5B4|nr:GPW/gp25 family protein [Citrobacter braakii]POT29244.1 hypothetical protein C3423_24545 [Citrobacter braakii]POT34103.1 hypothetical protein C3431_24365 [Citrobacter braakii]POT38928.1 hypothetical protein C3425_24380 [Citrobacter braakii]POU80471.1 hypothetical protein C3426_24400 [Citrobacter braakii]POV06447.1 hypothetical protein C3427_24595 [Citrobacter braakii]